MWASKSMEPLYHPVVHPLTNQKPLIGIVHAQLEFLSKHVDTHETWSQVVLSFLGSKEMQSPTQRSATDEKVSEPLPQNNQTRSARSAKSARNCV